MRTQIRLATVLATILTFTPHTTAQNNTSPYILTDDLSYTSFFDSFEFFSGPDPTDGFVQYANASSAISQGLVGYLADTQSVFLGVDHTTKDPDGRASVRLESTKSWNLGLLIADIKHMPASTCGSWPAYWLLSAKEGVEWPNGGEIDILEGVNDETRNAVTLHTSKGCVVDNTTSPAVGTSDGGLQAAFEGTMTTSDCDVAAEGQGKNVGCSIKAPARSSSQGLQTGGTNDADAILPSYGTPFNDVQGGVYAMEWTADGISVWFFPRNSASFTTYFPDTPLNATLPDPSSWPAPMAHFSGSGCSFTERFTDLKIIFDTTFCGQWAGREWDTGCKAKTGVDTCEEFVRENPEVFEDAYWEVGRMGWFQKEG